MEFSNVPGFGVEETKLNFTGFWDWFIAFNDVRTLWRMQPSYIYTQLLVLIGSSLTLYHALKNGGRFMHLWIGILLHGLVVEFVSYNLPDIDNFWHAQSPIIFLGRRLPLYIILIYLVFIYSAHIAVDKFKLPRWSEPLAVGLVVVLIDYPYDIMGVRLMHWTWHDTDPNIADRHYHVPWNSFYFHTAFAASFSFWFHFTRRIAFGKTDKWTKHASCLKEFACTVITALLGMPGGVLLFIPLYHPLHDIYKIHSEVTFFLLFAIFISIILFSFPKTTEKISRQENKLEDFLLLIYLVFHYFVFIGMAVLINPESEISVGWHEPIGPCNEKESMRTALGHIVHKRKYLCLTDNDETYFGWSCLPNKQPPKNGAKWYTICGTPFTDRMEYIVILISMALISISFFYKAFICQGCNLKQEQNLSAKDKKKIKSK